MKRILLLLALLALLLGGGIWWHLSHADVTVIISKNPRGKPRGIEDSGNGFRCSAKRSKLRGIGPKENKGSVTPAVATPSLSPAPGISGKPAPTFPPTAPPDTALAARGDINRILQLPSPDHATTAGRLAPLVLDPEFPAEQRAEALSHLLNLSAGHEAEVLLPLVRDRRLSEEDCRAILDDALNQSADWQSEIYLAALGARTEPKLRARIREHLAFLTGGADLGDDPKVWFEPLVQAAAARSR